MFIILRLVTKNLFSSEVDESDAVHSRLTTNRHFDIDEVIIIGEGLKLAPVGRTSTFTIQSRDIDTNDVNVKITGEILSQFFESLKYKMLLNVRDVRYALII